MTKRLLTALLALVFLLTAAPGRAADDEQELTDAEAREARDLARQFVERLREDNDVEPLVKDLFVRDFGARLRHERDNIPMAFVAPAVAARAGEEELRRFYVSEFNFFSRTLAYWLTHPPDKDDEDEECDEVSEIERMYPPEVFRVLRDDPVFSGMLAMEKSKAAAKEREQTDGDAEAAAESKPQPEEDGDATFVKDLSMLRAATVTTGKAAEALRAYTPEFSALRRMQEADVPEEAFEEVHWPRLETHEEDYFGFPPGTRFFFINVEPAHDIQFALILVREDGRLRILLAVPCFGD